MKKGTNVMMLTYDGYAKKGQLGVVTDATPLSGSPSVVRVQWANGRSFLHEARHLKEMGTTTDPNLAFLIQKDGRTSRD